MRFNPAADVAIVIAVHNRRAKTRRCLESLRAADGQDVAVIVVDDGSRDGTSEFLAAQDNLVVLHGAGDLWWTASVEYGCQHAISQGASVVLLLNDDNVVAPNLVPTLVAAVERTRGCVAAVVLENYTNAKGTIYQAGGTLNWRRRGIGLRSMGQEYREEDRVEPCDWLPGCALGFPAELFKAVGGFEPRLFPQYRGDIDFTVRARDRGYGCYVTFGTWVVNDLSDSPLTFRSRVSFADFLRGFVTLRSNYNIRETVSFAWRHCPKVLIPYYLAQFYARYAWAALKTQRLAFAAESRASRATI
jgi:GT2 family glycosyltransferase